MSPTVIDATAARHVLLPDTGARTAKAQVRKADKNPNWVKHGAAMREVQHAFVLTLKEFARELGKNERQIERQMQGIDRPMIEVVLAVEKFEGPMLIALARRTAGMEVDTVVHIRRRPSE